MLWFFFYYYYSILSSFSHYIRDESLTDPFVWFLLVAVYCCMVCFLRSFISSWRTSPSNYNAKRGEQFVYLTNKIRCEIMVAWFRPRNLRPWPPWLSLRASPSSFSLAIFITNWIRHVIVVHEHSERNMMAIQVSSYLLNSYLLRMKAMSWKCQFLKII